MVGSKYEKEGIIKAGSQFINAVSNRFYFLLLHYAHSHIFLFHWSSGVPAITVVLGASYGAGNYAMCGRAYKYAYLDSVSSLTEAS